MDAIDFKTFLSQKLQKSTDISGAKCTLQNRNELRRIITEYLRALQADDREQ